MIRKYLVIALRNIKRHKVISLINILGLAICMSVGLLIIIFMKTSFSIDSFHQKANRIYRVITKLNHASGTSLIACSPSPLADALRSDYPIVEDAVNIITFSWENILVRNIEIPVSTTFAGTTFFKIFDYGVLAGDASSFLDKPYSAVLSEDASVRIFGSENPLGKIITIKDFGDFTVTGLLANHTERSNLEDEIFLSRSTLYRLSANGKTKIDLDSWDRNYSSDTYVLLDSDASRIDLNNALDDISTNASKRVDKSNGFVNYEFKSLGLNEIPPSGLAGISGVPFSGVSPVGIGLFSMIAFVFTLMAVFNYTNLTMARSFARAREIGIRKAIGATRASIMTQILLESILFAILGLLLALGLINIIPLRGDFSRNLDLNILDSSLLIYALIFAIFTGLIAGIIPALALSRINPVLALGKILNIKLLKSIKARNLIVVAQFTACIIFLSVLFTLYRQGNFQTNSDLGFDRKNILTFPAPTGDVQVFQAELEKYSSITSVSLSSGRPVLEVGQVSNEKENSIPNLNYLSIDQNFIETWGLSLVAGRNFPRASSNSSIIYAIVNQKSIDYLGVKSPEQAIGQFISIDTLQAQVVGVVRDFHFRNFNFEIDPLALLYLPENFKFVSLKYQPEQYNNTLSYIKKVWKKFEPNFSVDISSYEEEYIEDQSHKEDQLTITLLSLIAILTSCMGLFGLVLHNMEQRTKEIAMRKILGSSILELIGSLSKNFFAILIFALCIGLPISYILSNEILSEFAYKVALNFDLALFVISIVSIIGFLTICTQALKASLANPVQALKSNE